MGRRNAFEKRGKAKGMRYLLKNQLSPEKPDKNFASVIEDGNGLFYVLKDIPHNFKEICFKLFTMVTSKTCCMIFGTDMERCRRRSGNKLIIRGASTKKLQC